MNLRPEEAKLCPFCGFKPELRVANKFGVGTFRMLCPNQDCGEVQFVSQIDREDVLNRWNNRTEKRA